MARPPIDKGTVTLLVRVCNNVGSLAKVIGLFEKHDVNMTRISSHPATDNAEQYDMTIDHEGHDTDANIAALLEELRSKCERFTVIGGAGVPWYPRQLSDLDLFTHKTLDYGSELNADHPGFHDEAYRRRRQEIVAKAQTYRSGQPLPRIIYLPEEIETWRTVYRNLTALYPRCACKQFQHVFPLLEQHCGYSEDNIPQLEDLSNFLKNCTGWTLRPVMGLLSARDFLNGLAFRVFHSTQYIRHPSRPLYTPEPDVCHELLGHVPMFADPPFAEFSQEIGLASLGASDADIEKLATLYWFTIEFGLCMQDGSPRAYGAGLLSSFGELEYALSDKPQRRPLDVEVASTTKYPITEYQPQYFVAESFEKATESVRAWASKLDRKFAVRYNPFTQRIDVINSKEKLMGIVHHVSSEVAALGRAMDLFV